MIETENPLKQQHFDYLDGWRGLAILFLLIGHFFPIPGINFGRLGVNLFFVLSGLLMCRLLFINHVPIPNFYRRRISRIFPAHYMLIALTSITYVALDRKIDWSEVAMASLFINNYFPGEIGNNVMPFGHIWSLSVEEHSYVLLSLIALCSRRFYISPLYPIGLFCIIFTFFGYFYATQFNDDQLRFELWPHSEISAYGIFVSALLTLILHNRTIPTLPALTYPALLLFAIALHWWSIPLPLSTFVGVGILAVTINLLSGSPQFIKTLLSLRPLRVLGVWSFSIYLWQQPFYLAEHREGLPAWLAVTLAILTGITSYYLLEKPARKFLNSRWTSGPVTQESLSLMPQIPKAGE